MSDLQNFRQLHSLTPGHPECNLTAGVEVTTGPLGQGIAQGVGLAIAAKHMASVFNKPNFNLFDNKVFVICGDGCLQEGVSGEASSLAGHLQLDNFIIIYDDNNITIDGKTSLSFTENSALRYKSYGFDTFFIADGNLDLAEMYETLDKALTNQTKPLFISLKTIIGYGTSKADTHGVHGAPLGPDVLAAFKESLGFDANKSFDVDGRVYERYAQSFGRRGKEKHAAWNTLLQAYALSFPDLHGQLNRMLKRELPADWKSVLPKFDGNSKKNALRSTNGEVLNALCRVIPEIIGGCADLTPSTKTQIKCSHDFQKDARDGRYLRFGVREFGMFAICNGISAYGTGLIPFSSTFLNFITYGWGAVRVGALSELQHVYIMTHDSVYLGEDGPTHQPVEVFPLIRLTPNIQFFRPADGNEVCATWIQALERNLKTPTVMALTRQGVEPLDGSSVEGTLRGAYVIKASRGDQKDDEEEKAEIILIATGSEVVTCVKAKKMLQEKGKKTRVVSAPCLELFDGQSLEYKKSVLLENAVVVSVEASSSSGWARFAHKHVCIDRFGMSGPAKMLEEEFGFTPQKIAEFAIETCQKMAGKPVPILPCLY